MNGIPARWQSGWAYSEDVEGHDTMHDWGALYLAPYGWVPMDVTSGQLASDDPALEAVHENRRRAAAAVLPGARLVGVYQVHGADCLMAGDWSDDARPPAAGRHGAGVRIGLGNLVIRGCLQGDTDLLEVLHLFLQPVDPFLEPGNPLLAHGRGLPIRAVKFCQIAPDALFHLCHARL